MTTNFELFFKRIKKAANVNTDKELYEFLNINKTTLSMWKSREKVDYELLFKKFEQINIHWLITGNGSIDLIQENDESKIVLLKKENEDLKETNDLLRFKVTTLEKEINQDKSHARGVLGTSMAKESK